MIRENFREFCTTGNMNIGTAATEMNNIQMDITNHQYHIIDDSRLQQQMQMQQPAMPIIAEIPSDINNSKQFGRSESIEAETETEAKFSDDEDQPEVGIKNEETDDDDDLPLSKVTKKKKMQNK